MAIPNTFVEKAQRFVSVLDEIYQAESKTSILEVAGTVFTGTNKVRVPKIDLDGAADYDRVKGYVDGAVTVEYDELELMFDRGRRFRIDVIDDDEAAFDLYRRVATEYVRVKEIPEMDAIRFMRMAENAGKLVAENITAANALEAFDNAELWFNDAEVFFNNRVLFVSSEYYKAMKNDEKISRRLDANTNNGTINRAVSMLDGETPVIIVPKRRFYDNILVKDGVSTEQATGGFAPIPDTSHELNFIYVATPVAQAITKRRVSKIILPDVNQQADAYDIPYRTHHDLIVNANKKNGIYVSHKTATV